jgi:hypothetical protein
LKELKADISIVDILSHLPIHSLALKISEGSKILPGKLRVEGADVRQEDGNMHDGAGALGAGTD